MFSSHLYGFSPGTPALLKGVNVSVNGCLPRMYAASCPVAAEICSINPAALNWISRRKSMDRRCFIETFKLRVSHENITVRECSHEQRESLSVSLSPNTQRVAQAAVTSLH